MDTDTQTRCRASVFCRGRGKFSLKNSLEEGKETTLTPLRIPLKSRIASWSRIFQPMLIFLLYNPLFKRYPLTCCSSIPGNSVHSNVTLTAHCSSRLEKTLCSPTAFAKISWEHLPKPVRIVIIFSGFQNSTELFFAIAWLSLPSCVWKCHSQPIQASHCWSIVAPRLAEISVFSTT